MPLTAKGKKLKKKFREQYGEKKGDSIFYAMENSGKLKKVIKARGGRDASSADFGKENVGGGNGREQYGSQGQYKPPSTSKGDGSKNITVRSGPGFINPRPLGLLTPISYQLATSAINVGKKRAYDRRNLVEQKKVDVLGGEMLTTGTKGSPKTKNTGGDGTTPNQPIKPITMTKKIDTKLINPKENFFNFKAFKVGGLSGGVSYGPPPKSGPNPQVPPIKMKTGGQK